MTEKRFISATYDNQSWLRLYLGENEYESYRPSELLDLLNGLVDENVQLRHDATVLIQSNQEYRKENDELKQYKQAVSDILWDWYRKDGSLTIWRIMKELNVDGDVE